MLLILFSPILGAMSTVLTTHVGESYQSDKGGYRDSLTNEDLTIDSTAFSKAAPRSGVQTFAVICVRFSDNPNSRWTFNEIDGIMSDIDDFWYNAS